MTPAWFTWAVDQAPQHTTIEIDGAPIELLAWGRRGAPGLLFLHGNMANAYWWGHIAPFFADRFRVAALSFSGMGGSGHRPEYSLSGFTREALAAADAAGFWESTEPAAIMAHSAGGGVACALAADPDTRFGRAIIVDSAIIPPRAGEAGQLTVASREYPTIEAALERFRLVPAQPVRNAYILDWIGRRGLCRAPSGIGWTWSFDPRLRGQFTARGGWDLLPRLQCDIHFINGARSSVTTRDRTALMLGRAPRGTSLTTIPDAYHHVAIDQPLALIDAASALLQPRFCSTLKETERPHLALGRSAGYK